MQVCLSEAVETKTFTLSQKKSQAVIVLRGESCCTQIFREQQKDEKCGKKDKKQIELIVRRDLAI